VHVDAAELIDVHIGLPVTAEGVHGNVSVAIRYIEAWLRGLGAVAIDNLMEDAATAEISRSQIWQWVHNGSQLDDGTTVTAELVRHVVADELAEIRSGIGDDAFNAGMFGEAGTLFEAVALDDSYAEFLTLPAYEVIR
jgi:malate synthase